MSVRRILMPLTLAAMAAFCAEAAAQGAFPAPLPNQSQSGSAAAAPAASSPFPPAPGAPAQRPASAFPAPSGSNPAASQGVFSAGAAPLGGGLGAGAFSGDEPRGGGGGGSAEQQECMQKFAPLREDAEKRAKAIKAASERKAPAQEACGLIKSYVAAEAKLVNYVTTKQTACAIPPEIPKQLKANAARSHQMLKAVCNAAAGQAQGSGPAAAPSLSEALGSSNVAPEIRSARGSGASTFDTINGNVLAR